MTMYAAPIVYSPMLYLLVHHNVLSLDFSLLCGLVESVTFPALLIVLCAELQLEYWQPLDRDMIRRTLGIVKLVLAGVMFFCVQRHPLFNELKALAGRPTDSLTH